MMLYIYIDSFLIGHKLCKMLLRKEKYNNGILQNQYLTWQLKTGPLAVMMRYLYATETTGRTTRSQAF